MNRVILSYRQNPPLIVPPRLSLFCLAVTLSALFHGCFPPKYIELTYHPQENVVPIEEASNIAVKVIVCDLRKEANNIAAKNKVGSQLRHAEATQVSDLSILAKNDLRELTAHAIETELMNRGFKLGESVVVEVDLIKFYYYSLGPIRPKILRSTPDRKPGTTAAEIILHVDVKSAGGTPVFSRLVKGRNQDWHLPIPIWDIRDSKNRYLSKQQLEKLTILHENNRFITPLNSALKNGVSKLVNDPEFINALIKADTK